MRGYKPELDGIRGIAILSVLLAHTANVSAFDVYPHTEAAWPIRALLSFGWVGVDLFFVLSGFLITGILLNTKHATNYLSSFYIRRILRIAPIYYLTVLGLFCLSRWNIELREIVPPLKPYLLYIQNWPAFLPHPPLALNIFGHFWSLAVEEQFYLVWPFVVLALPEWTLLLLCGAGLVIALPLRLFMGLHYGFDFVSLMTLTTSRMDGLLFGAGIAIFSWRYGRPVPMRWIIVGALAGAGIISAIVIRNPNELIYSGPFMHTFGVSGVALVCASLVAASQHPIRWLGKLLGVRLLRACGKYAYGMYVYHLAIYALASKAITALPRPFPIWAAILYSVTLPVFVFVVAKFSYNVLESRILALKGRFEASSEPVVEASHSNRRAKLVPTACS